MEVSNVSQTEFESMFGGQPADTKPNPADSGFSFDNKASLFTKTEEPIIPDPLKPVEEKPKEGEPNEDSLFNGSPAEPKEDIFNIKSYFTKKIKDGAFLGFEDDKLETPEDIDALIEANFNHKIESLQEDVNNQWYENKTNAWKFVAQYAENVDNPYDLLPLLQGVQTIEAINNLDPNKPEEAELIVRAALERRGEAPSIIEDQILTFKEGNKLEKLAADYQPLLIQEENQKLIQLKKQEAEEEQRNLQLLNDIHENAIKVIETPFLGKHKLKREEKAAVYDLIARPDQEAGGYQIFKAIDNLYATNDFETLREIALMVANKKAHRSYLGIDNIDAANEKLFRKLKDAQTSTTRTVEEKPEAPKLQRSSPSRNDSGFGFFNK